jgi:hypothetical protein
MLRIGGWELLNPTLLYNSYSRRSIFCVIYSSFISTFCTFVYLIIFLVSQIQDSCSIALFGIDCERIRILINSLSLHHYLVDQELAIRRGSDTSFDPYHTVPEWRTLVLIALRRLLVQCCQLTQAGPDMRFG